MKNHLKNEENVANLTRLFNEIDENKDGALDNSELTLLISNYFAYLKLDQDENFTRNSEIAARLLLQALDKDGNQTIELSELISGSKLLLPCICFVMWPMSQSIKHQAAVCCSQKYF
eukprot:TRINITY_DN1927_c0_g1_i1.p1 TRINITY_DN1927_c0_g1~~TRINITY_DN1927_c0_g1_i1.p1  ORF type:complete len:130 (+),score=24.49 TRINITY_DN1927_c0_g1_i1:40-390(+)